MNRGFLLFVQQNEDTDYLTQASVCAKSIKQFNPDEKVCLVTDSTKDFSNHKEFDLIKSIPGEDLAKDSKWKIQNRSKIYDISPFKETIVLDVDTLVLENIQHYWNFLKSYKVFYTTQVKTYRDELVTSNFYRQTFEANNLPNVYCGFHYFKRCPFSQKFYDTVKDVVKNYEFYKKRYTYNYPQRWCSMDVSTAITIRVLDCEHLVCAKQSPINFIHMKSKIQNWRNSNNNWLGQIDFQINKDYELFVGNYLQKGIFHYVEDGFLNNNVKEIFNA